MQKFLSIIFISTLFCSSLLSAQEKFTLSGYVKETGNGEDMLGVNVYEETTLRGTTTNEYGFYSMTLPKGTYQIVFSFIGFETKRETVVLDQNVRLNKEIAIKAIQTQEVTISSERADRNIQDTKMGIVELPTEQIKSLPSLLGEVDILRTLQLLPGVQAAGEGNSGFYVRGGGADQNLILLDNAVVYNTGHLFGFFSVFNSDAIKNTTLIKGGMPANYGGRLSSVVDISMKEGNMKKFEAEGGIGLISSRLTLQGPLKKNKASFLVSGRRTYIDILAKPFLKRARDGDFAGNSYYFYDINAKLNYKISDKDRFFLSGYFGRDVFNFKSTDDAFNFTFPWGNATATARWNHLFSNKLFMNAMAIYNDYKFEVSSQFQDVTFNLNSGVRDFTAKTDFDYYANVSHSLKFGASYTYHIFTPYSATGQAGETEFETNNIQKKYAHEAAAYVLDEWDVSDRVKVNAGVRFSLFSHVGPLEKIVFDELGRAIDTLNFKVGEGVATYAGIEPRINARIKLDDYSSLKLGFTYNNQYIHLVSSSTTTLPTDLWVPSTAIVKPQRGWQASAGYFRNFFDNMLETSIEVYYKSLRNQIEYGSNSVPELNVDLEESFVFGNGWSYGAEFFIKKRYGKVNGWIGYTLAFTERKFPELNEGLKFPAKYDRRHDLSIVAIYDVSKKWRISSTFVYGTGQATTVPTGRYFINGEIVNEYGSQNGFRLDPYHRLDFAATLFLKTGKRYSDLTFSVYNLYNRKNPFFIYYDVEGDISDGTLDVQAKQVSLFPVLPSITWNFRF